MKLIWLNGHFIKSSDDLSVTGISEKIEVSNGEIIALENSLKRLFDLANSLLVEILFLFEEFMNSCLKLVEHNKILNGYIYPSFYIKDNQSNFKIICATS